MNNKKLIKLAAVLCVVMMALSIGMIANSQKAYAEAIGQGTCGDNLVWELDDKGVLTISGTGEMTSCPWNNDNYRDDVKKVIIEDGVISIAEAAFKDCKYLSDISLPNSIVSISQYAFSGCGAIDSLSLPNGLITVYEFAFQDCAFSNVELPASLTNIRRGAFFNCPNLTSIEVPQNVSLIGASAFPYTTSVMFVGDAPTFSAAFDDNVEITYPCDNNTWNNEVFGRCPDTYKWKENHKLLHLDEKAPTCGVNGNISHWICQRCQKHFVDENCVEYENEEWAIPKLEHESLIQESAYGEDGEVIYWRCPRCDSLFVNEDKTGEIDETSVFISRGICGDDAKWTLDYSGTLIVSGSGTITKHSLDEYPWYDDRQQVKKIIVGEGITNLPEHVFYSSKVEEVSLADSITTIERRAFGWCGNLTGELHLPDSLVSIGESAFYTCKITGTLNIPKNVTTIGKSAFGNTSIEAISWPDSLTRIEGTVFSGCKNLTGELVLPEGIEYIGDNAFTQTGIRSIIIPKSIKTIFGYAFNSCESLKTVKFLGRVPEDNGYQWFIYDTLTAYCPCNAASSAIGKSLGGTVSWKRYHPDLNHYDEVDSTCVSEGLKAHWYCSECKRYYSNSTASNQITRSSLIIPQKEHILERTDAKEPTCTPGNTAYWTCSSCGKYFEDRYGFEEIEQNSWVLMPVHSNIQKHSAIEPTCTEDGNNAYWECIDCGSFFSDANCSIEINENAWIIPGGHFWTDKPIVDTEATCTEEGMQSIHCLVCGEKKDEEVIQAQGHRFGEWETITPSTCEDSGLHKHICETCGFAETEGMNPNGHEWEDSPATDILATCTKEGSQSYHCKNCDAVKDSEVIPAIGHEWDGDLTVDKKATCTTDGSQSVHCKACDEIKDKSAIQATGHKWNAPTYTWSKDYKTVIATRTCKNDSGHKETETAKTTSIVTKKATYTAKGQTTYTAVFKNSAFAKQTKTLTNIAQLPKKTNTIIVKTKKPAVKFAKLKKRAQTITTKKAFAVSKAQGRVIYKKVSGNKKITINSAGKITLKKGLKKGTYKIKVKVTAGGTTVYKAGAKTVTIRIKVK